jgi:hypothetical protein
MRNLQKKSRYFGKKKKILTEVKIIECDVVNHEIQDDENIFFIFNAFDGVILDRVLGNIAQSLRKKPRKIWLIYCNPAHEDILERQSDIRKIGDYMLEGCKFSVYANHG